MNIQEAGKKHWAERIENKIVEAKKIRQEKRKKRKLAAPPRNMIREFILEDKQLKLLKECKLVIKISFLSKTGKRYLQFARTVGFLPLDRRKRICAGSD